METNECGCFPVKLSMDNEIGISCNFHISQTVGRIWPSGHSLQTPAPDSESNTKVYVTCPQKKKEFKHTQDRVVFYISDSIIISHILDQSHSC